MKRLFQLAIGLLLGANLPLASAAANKHEKPHADARGVTIAALPGDIFALESIPAAHRSGVAQAVVLREFERLAGMTKQEFESSADYASRVNTAWRKSPVSPLNGPLGFVVDAALAGIEVSYDADTQRYQLNQGSSLAGFCQLPARRLRRSTNVDLCVVGLLDHKESVYRGQNAFGVGAQVDQERGTYLSLAVSRNSRFVTGYQDHLYRFNDAIDFPLERSRGYRTADLKMMLVGEISGTDLIEGEGTFLSPKIDSPVDISIDNKGIPFKVQAVIYFFRNDGRIVAIRDFRDKS
jgi:hypothetical protein